MLTDVLQDLYLLLLLFVLSPLTYVCLLIPVIVHFYLRRLQRRDDRLREAEAARDKAAADTSASTSPPFGS